MAVRAGGGFDRKIGKQPQRQSESPTGKPGACDVALPNVGSVTYSYAETPPFYEETSLFYSCSANFAPHELQKRASRGFNVPHWEQIFIAVETGLALVSIRGSEATRELVGLFTSSIKLSFISRKLCRNSVIALPTLLPISGRREGPKINRATIAITIKWMGCIPNGMLSSLFSVYLFRVSHSQPDHCSDFALPRSGWHC